MSIKKKISFVRHAKSSWTDPSLADIDRPLNSRGLRDRDLMSAKFKSLFSIPDLLISSPAKRAYSTATTFAKAFGYSTADIHVEKRLYHADIDDFESVILEQDNTLHSLMIFSHNPGLTYLANDYAANFIDNVPTTGIFTLESQVSNWLDFFKKSELIDFIYPKMYV